VTDVHGDGRAMIAGRFPAACQCRSKIGSPAIPVLLMLRSARVREAARTQRVHTWCASAS
jgi:hypothetical protein